MLSPRAFLSEKSWWIWALALGLLSVGAYAFMTCRTECDFAADDFKPDVTVSMEDTTPKTVVFASHDPLDRELAQWWVKAADEYEGFCGLAWASHLDAVKKEVPKARRGIVWSMAWIIAKERGSSKALTRLSHFAASETEWNDAEFLLTIEQELQDPTSDYWVQAITALGHRDVFHAELGKIAETDRPGSETARRKLAE